MGKKYIYIHADFSFGETAHKNTRASIDIKKDYINCKQNVFCDVGMIIKKITANSGWGKCNERN